MDVLVELDERRFESVDLERATGLDLLLKVGAASMPIDCKNKKYIT